MNTEKRMGWRELLMHPLIKQKEEEPIGDRFLVQNDLHLPEVNLDLKLEPTTVTNIKGEEKRDIVEISNSFDMKSEPKK